MKFLPNSRRLDECWLRNTVVDLGLFALDHLSRTPILAGLVLLLQQACPGLKIQDDVLLQVVAQTVPTGDLPEHFGVSLLLDVLHVFEL